MYMYICICSRQIQSPTLGTRHNGGRTVGMQPHHFLLFICLSPNGSRWLVCTNPWAPVEETTGLHVGMQRSLCLKSKSAARSEVFADCVQRPSLVGPTLTVKMQTKHLGRKPRACIKHVQDNPEVHKLSEYAQHTIIQTWRAPFLEHVCKKTGANDKLN